MITTSRSHLRRALHARIADHDRGVAMVMVLGVVGVLGTLLVAGIAYSVSSMRTSRDDQNWSAALAAAYAGVEEYESRLANDLAYWSYGNPTATFSTGSTLTLPTGAAANPAFGIGVAGTWATIAGSGGTSQFRYEVDNSEYYVDGTLRLRSTGRVGDETRTIVADLKQLGFIDFLYFTDYEVMDPQALNPASATNCAIRYPNARPGCTTIFFGGADTIAGPLHTNDAIQTNGAANFAGRVTTAWDAPAAAANYVRAGGTTAPVFANTGDPQAIGEISMPATNSELKKETRSDLPTEVPVTGCLYTGPTSIQFHADGTMTVISPWTRRTNTSGAGATAGSSPAECGTPGNAGLASRAGGVYVGQRFAIPANLVVYVQNVPSVATDVNYTASATTAPYPGGVACAASANNLGYPIANEAVPFAAAYGCRNGDVFVRGTLDGSITVAAENYVYVTGDLVYENGAATSDDILGLVGNNAVWVWNPMDLLPSGNYASLLGGTNRSIDAAILSVSHTFMVQNYNRGAPRGTLNVTGAIAQKFRGPVAQTSGGAITTGYAKNYVYDDRFSFTAPPKFLTPVTTTYGVNTWIEVSPAFAADGSYR